MKELRLNFSDYTAEEQEVDVRRHKARKVIRHAYLMKIDGEWGHFIINQQGDDIKFYGQKSLTEVYYELKENRPDYTARVIQNEGLENYLRDIKARRNRGKLKIDFKGYAR